MKKMNISASKFSSGCESGWTFYLDQSYVSESKFQKDNKNNNDSFAECGGKGVRELDDEEEEEDLSMVSDASSGPPHYYEDCYCENGSSFSASNWAYNKNNSAKKDREKKKKKMLMMKEKCKIEHHSCLDDTASSPVSKKKSTLSGSEDLMENNILDYSQGFSATHFMGESAFGNHFGVFQSSLAKSSASQKPGDFQGGNWKRL